MEEDTPETADAAAPSGVAEAGAEPGITLADARLLHTVVHVAPAMIAYCDRDEIYRFANAAYCRRFGLEPEQVIGRHIREIVGENAYRTAQPHLKAVLAGECVDFEKEFDLPVLGKRFMHAQYMPCFEGEKNPARVSGLVALISDITRRKEAENKVRESEERFRQMADDAPVLIWLSDENKKGIYFNAGWLEFTGRSPEQELGDGWLEGIHPDDQERAARTCRRAFERREDFRMEFRLRRGDGAWRWVLDHGVPRFDSEGRLLGYIGSCIDVTERHQSEAALEAHKQRLLEADRRKDEFLAMLSHELRNPLAAIANVVGLLKRTQGGQDALGPLLDVLDRQTGSLSRIVDDLLDVSRITRGQIELKREVLDLRSLAAAAADSLRLQARARNQALELRLPEASLLVEGDRVRLEQIIVNLLNNAHKYTPEGGRITLSLESSGEAAELRVRDTGIGLQTDMLESVFTLFTQAERGIDRAEGGLGVGLTVVKRLLELHGGTIQAFSEGLGQGAEFRVTLPLTDKSPAAPSEAGRRQSAAGKRVLVVDDSEDVAVTMGRLLEFMGHEVCTADSGEEALVKVESFQPEVILLDLGMPGMDGYELARRLRGNERTRRARLAALTGYDKPRDQEMTRQAGFDAHFVKPVALDALDLFIKGSA